jgi:hypothetical protein
VPDSLLARVAGLGVATNVAAPWEHPLRADFLPAHQEQLFHGEAFSLSIRGAVILYNLMLAEHKAQPKSNAEAQLAADELVERYRAEFLHPLLRRSGSVFPSDPPVTLIL